MADETEIGSAGATQGRGHPRGSSGEQSPLQARAAFLKNRSWEFVISLNRGACERGSAQHGFNPETQAACRSEWEAARQTELTLAATFDLLRSFHRRAPFLFFNGNTFADIGRQLANLLLADLPTGRRREAASAVAHYVAGVLDRDVMVAVIESLCETADFQPGDRIKTLRGSTHGVIIRMRPDGKIVWRPDRSVAELIALPESVIREKS